MNPLSPHLLTGTVGELIVQLRLLECDVQSVPTHKDTGNDLLATRGETFRAIQVKTTRSTDGQIEFKHRKALTRKFHILALVFLEGQGDRLEVDRSHVYVLARNEVEKGRYSSDELSPYLLTKARIDDLFTGPSAAS